MWFPIYQKMWEKCRAGVSAVLDFYFFLWGGEGEKEPLFAAINCQVPEDSIGPACRDLPAGDLAVSDKWSTFILTLPEDFDWNYICPDNTQQSALLAFVSRYIWKQARWPWTQLLFQFRTSLWAHWIIFLNVEKSTSGETFYLLYTISPIMERFFPPRQYVLPLNEWYI